MGPDFEGSEVAFAPNLDHFLANQLQVMTVKA
jgi:hypothetical protein